MRAFTRALAAALAMIGAPASPQVYQPTPHTRPPLLFDNIEPQTALALADAGAQVERDRSPAWQLAEHRRLTAALATLQPQRPGTVDAYVVAVGMDSDAVFGREAREAAAVLSRRYDAAGRTLLLAGTDGAADSQAPRGAPDHLALALARVAELMDAKEDVLVLYVTTHGAPFGLFYNDGDAGAGAVSPTRLWTNLSQLGIHNRLLILSACFAGVFVPMLQSPTTAIVTAASADRTSFGCQADSDWTFFGDALVNHALRKPQPLAAASAEAFGLIEAWEAKGKLTPSQPQLSIGSEVSRWLAPLDARMPRGTTPQVGRPAITILDDLKR
jgi:hypothetical protein